MKKKLSIILVLCMLSATGIIALAKAITINTNGVTRTIYPYPVIVNERTFCTADAFYSQNCEVIKIPYYKVVILQKGDIKIFMQANNKEYFVYDKNIDGDVEGFMQTKEGETLTFAEAPFINEGIFYVPVREVCEKLGYRVEWENNLREVLLTCDAEWQDTENADKDFTWDVKRYFEKLELIEKNIISDERYEEGNFSLLYEYGILNESEEEYITYREALSAFAKLLRAEGDGDIKYWYEIDKFEPLDEKITEEDKELLLSIMDWRGVIRQDEILEIDMDASIIEGDALKFAIRSVGSTYGCTDYPEEMDYTTDEEVYPSAVKKGFIENADTKNSEEPMERNAFYELLNKALFVEHTTGGYSGAIGTRYIDYFDSDKKSEKTPEKEWVTKSEEIEVLVKNDNLNFTWKKPEFIPNDYFTSVDAITENGEERGYRTSGRANEEISDTQIIEILVRNKEEKIEKLKVTYSDSDWTLRESVEYYFYIDFSTVTVVHEGTPPTPGVYYRNKRQWPMKKLSLKEGEEFEKGKFYVIVGKDHTYRKEEYNYTSYSAFKAVKTENTVTDFGTTGTIGTSYFDEVRLIEAEIIDNRVTISSISEHMFSVEEL